MEPGEEGPHPRLPRTLLRKRQKKRGIKKKQQQQTAGRKAKRRVTRRCLLADTALMRRNHSFISCHLWEITTMAAAGCRWSRRDIRSRKKKKQLWEDEDQNRVWPTFRGANIRELGGKKNKQKKNKLWLTGNADENCKKLLPVSAQWKPSFLPSIPICYWSRVNGSSDHTWLKKHKCPEFFKNKRFTKVEK